MADKRRRKSLRLFRPRSAASDSHGVPSITSSPTESRNSDYLASSPCEKEIEHVEPRVRPRVLQKATRSSVFGSLRSLNSLDEDEKYLTRSDSKSSSFGEDGASPGKNLFGDKVERYAELQMTGSSSMFRKRSYFVVLTESHLIRFKSQQKAAEMFQTIPMSGAKGNIPRSSMGSFGSYTEMQTSAYMDITQGVPLGQVVAVYKMDDGRPFFTIEVAYLDDRARRASTMQLSFSEPKEAETWTGAIRNAARQTREAYDSPLQSKTLDHITRVLQRAQDYDPDHCHSFPVVQRSMPKFTGKGSADDLTKLATSVSYIAIGVNKVHIIPAPRTSGRSSSTSLHDLDTPSSFGIMCLSAIRLGLDDDAFELRFRVPLRHDHTLLLASVEAPQIALWLRHASEYLRPEWTVQPFLFDVPKHLEDTMDPPTFPTEDNGCFDRTLIAFCAAFDVDASRIYYSVDFEGEDAPCFRLLPPLNGVVYSEFEVLAVMRALRYNESFASISFAGISLQALHDLCDPRGGDDDSLCTRSGLFVQLTRHSELSVLQQEIRALALKSRRLRRMDFSNTLLPTSDARGKVSCGIPEALTPLCKRSLTNVDWIVLNGIRLSEQDLDFLVDAASERQCHIRALEIAESGLSVQEVDVLLSTLNAHDNTMEVVNVSGAQGRWSPELFQRSMGGFSRIRKLNLTRVQKTAGSEPLLAPEILLGWRLESLQLNQTTINEQTVDCIAAYLASPKSDTLRELSVDQCGLTGRDLAVFFQAMSRNDGLGRNLHISANDNRLGTSCSLISKCIARNYAPASLSMRMMDFEKEQHFRELILALSSNTTIRSLDISRASLPYDAGPETCEALKDLFSNNQTLEELDISGDVAHLDTARFGIGLNVALLGLANNKSLKMLRIEHQSLGMQGANTLAEVIEKNQSLVEIHCENNDLNLQSFTVLVNALSKNKTILYLPDHTHDKARSLAKVRDEFQAVDHQEEPNSPKAGRIRKSMHVLSGYPTRSNHHRHRSSMSAHSNGSFTAQDVNATFAALEEQWQTQNARLERYLLRNYQLSSGMHWSDHDDGRPQTADSLGKLLARVKLDRTPTLERTISPLDFDLHEKNTMVFSLPED